MYLYISDDDDDDDDIDDDIDDNDVSMYLRMYVMTIKIDGSLDLVVGDFALIE